MGFQVIGCWMLGNMGIVTYFFKQKQLPPHMLLLLISSKRSFICTYRQTRKDIPLVRTENSPNCYSVIENIILSIYSGRSYQGGIWNLNSNCVRCPLIVGSLQQDITCKTHLHNVANICLYIAITLQLKWWPISSGLGLGNRTETWQIERDQSSSNFLLTDTPQDRRCCSLKSVCVPRKIKQE